MALFERVATLVRANLNDLLDKAEEPEKILKQVILDIENQYIQVKTQTAIALADLHLLQKKKQENSEKHTDWMRRAELAIAKNDEPLARAAIDRALSFEQLQDSFAQQISDQEAQVEALKAALTRLDIKLSEARTKAEFLITQNRRSRSARKAARAQQAPTNHALTFDRMRAKIAREDALGQAETELLGDDLDGRLYALEREQKIDSLLQELKQRTGMTH